MFFNTSSQVKKSSGITILLFAESSRVLSNIIDALLFHRTSTLEEASLQRESFFHLLIGFRLKGIAEEPTCLDPNVHSNSPIGGLCSNLMLRANLESVPHKEARVIPSR